MKKEFDVLILGYYGFGNLGDELLAEASIVLLRGCGVPTERIAILSASPEKSAKKFGVRAFDRWKLSSVLKACSMSRTLLLGGGGLFQDSTSIRSCVYYFAIVLIAKMKGLKVWAEGQSVGPLRSFFARRLAAAALSMCSHISVRDESSFEVTSSLGLKASLIHDLVMSLAPEASGKEHKPIILFNVRPGYENLSRAAAEKCRKLAATNGWKVRGIALAEEDAREITKLQSLQCIDIQDIITVHTMAEFSEAAAGASGAVGMRLHFLVLCRLLGIPALASAYDPKVSGFCKRSGVAMMEDDISRFSAYESDVTLSAAYKEIKAVFAEGVRCALGDKK